MLKDIFFINSRDSSVLNVDLTQDNFSNMKIISYPKKLSNIVKNKSISDLILNFKEKVSSLEVGKNKTPVLYSPLITEGINIYSCLIYPDAIIGLILDKDDNPYDLKEIFEDQINKYFLPQKKNIINNHFELETLLISIFIDIRRYYDEILGYSPFLAFRDHGSILKVFIFGLDEAGKTSYVRRITTGEYDKNYYEPTRQFNIDHYTHNDYNFIFWDVPGQVRLRSRWLLGMQDSNMLIYMIDAADEVRFEESKKELWNILVRYELEGVPLLILANKIDLPYALTSEKELITHINLNEITNRTWDIMTISVADNINIKKSLDWLSEKASTILPDV